MGLFKPAWMSKNEKRALRALDDAKRSGFGDWEKAAKTAPLLSVRYEAYRRLREAYLQTPEHRRSQRFGVYFNLAGLAGSVIWGFDDPEELIELVRNGEGDEIRFSAARAFRSGFDLLAPELDEFGDNALGTIAEECGDLALALRAAQVFGARKPDGYNLGISRAIEACSGGISPDEALRLLDEYAGNASVLEGLVGRIGDDARLKDIALGSERRGLVVRVRDAVKDPSIRQEVANHLERIDRAREKEERRAQQRAEREQKLAAREEFRALADKLEGGRGIVTAREFDSAVGDLTDPRDVERALILADYRQTWDFDNLFDLPQSNAWKLLCRQHDDRLLRRVASKAKSEAVRWKACKMIGGHFPPKDGSPDMCRCGLCGFEVHTASSGATSSGRWTCAKCGGDVETPGFSTGFPRSWVTYHDGTKLPIRGYDGLLHGERVFAEREGLF